MVWFLTLAQSWFVLTCDSDGAGHLPVTVFIFSRYQCWFLTCDMLISCLWHCWFLSSDSVDFFVCVCVCVCLCVRMRMCVCVCVCVCLCLCVFRHIYHFYLHGPDGNVEVENRTTDSSLTSIGIQVTSCFSNIHTFFVMSVCHVVHAISVISRVGSFFMFVYQICHLYH